MSVYIYIYFKRGTEIMTYTSHNKTYLGKEIKNGKMNSKNYVLSICILNY